MTKKLKTKQNKTFYRVKKVFIALPALVIVFSLYLTFAPSALAAVITWDGGGTDGTCGGVAGDGNKWSCAANWSTNTVPTSTDVATFDGTSTKDVAIDSGFAGTIGGINIKAGYTGTITQARSLTIGTSSFAMAAGSWSSGANTIYDSGSFTLSGGTFTAPSSSLSFELNFTITGGSFVHNSGTVIVDDDGGAFDSTTMSCNGVTFSKVQLNKSSRILTITVGSNCSLPLGNSPTTGGTITNNGTFTIGTGTWTVNNGNSYTQNAGATLVFGGTLIDSNTLNGLIFNGGTLTTSTLTTINTSAGLNNSGNVLPNGLILNIDGGDVGTITCGNATFSSVTIQKIIYLYSVVIAADCTIPLGNSPVTSGVITNNGTITVGTGTWSHSGSYTQNSGSSLTFSGILWDVNGLGITLNGGTMSAPNLTAIQVEGDLLNTGNILPNNLSITLNGTATNSNVACGNASFSAVAFSKTSYLSVITVGADCAMTFGNNPVTVGSIVNNGSLTLGSGTWSGTGNYSQGSTGSLHFNGTVIDINDGGFVLASGTASLTNLTTLSVEQNLDNSGNLLPNGVALTLDGNLSSDDAIVTCGTATFSSVLISKSTTSVADVTIGADCTFNLGNSPTSSASITNNGSVTVGTGTWLVDGGYTQNTGSSLTMSSSTWNVDDGNLTLSGGTLVAPSLTTLELERNLTNTTNLLPNGLALTLDGTSQDDSVLLCGTASFSSMLINKSNVTDDVTFASNCTSTGAFTRTNGIVNNSPSAVTLTVQGNFAMSTTDAFGGTNLTLNFGGASSQTVSQNAANTFSSPMLIDKSGGLLALSTALTASAAPCTVIEGTFNVNGFAFSCGGTFTIQDGGALQLNGGETITTPVLNTGSTVVYSGNGNGLSTAYTIKDYTYHNLTINALDGALDTFSLAGDKTVAGALKITAGTLNSSGAIALTVNQALTINGGVMDQGTLNITAQSGIAFSSGSLLGGSGNIDSNGDVNISGGTFTAPAGTIMVSGNFIHPSGTFSHNSGTVVLDGSDQSILGSTTFNNLTKIITGTARILTLESGKTQTVLGTMRLEGESGALLSLRSSSSPTQAIIDSQGTRTVNYLDVMDNNNSNTTAIDITGRNITNSGNNLGWGFVVPPTPDPTPPTPTPDPILTPTVPPAPEAAPTKLTVSRDNSDVAVQPDETSDTPTDTLPTPSTGKTKQTSDDDQVVIEVTVVNEQNQAVSGAKVRADSDEDYSTTNEKGIAVLRVTPGPHWIFVSYNGHESRQNQVIIQDTDNKMSLTLKVKESTSSTRAIMVGLALVIIVALATYVFFRRRATNRQKQYVAPR